MSNTNNTMQTQTSNAIHNAIIEAGGKDRPPMLAPGNYNPPYKFKWTEKTISVAEGSSETRIEGFMETYKTIPEDIRKQLDVEAEAVQIILIRTDNDIYSTVNACPNACEMWKAIERLKQVLTSTTTRMEKNEVNKIRAERLEHTANPLALVAQHQLVYHPQSNPTHYTQNSSTYSQQAATKNKGKAIVNSTYDQEPDMEIEDDEMSKGKEIDKLMALIFLSFKKIYKPTNNNLRTSSSSNTSRTNHDNTPRINRGTGFQLNAEQADWKDDTDDEPCWEIDCKRLNTGSITIQDQGPTSGIRANRGTLNKKNHKITNKHSPTILYKMSQPANDEFSQHLSDDEESNHEDASDTGAAPKQQQQVIPQTTAISNIKLPILKKEEYDIWAMEMEHLLIH
ncbi:hypothetical protein Tco_0525971 [Tanacetum coccineum]